MKESPRLPPDVLERRDALRRAIRARRAALSPGHRARASERVVERLAAWPLLRTARRVALYAPLPTELDVAPLAARLAAGGVECVWPRRIPGGGPPNYAFAPARGLADMRRGAYGVLEPVSPPVPTETIDVFIVPGVAFDRRGHRLGQGAGVYDRLLAARRRGSVTVGVGFGFQLVDNIDAAPWDVALDAVVTDAEWVQVAP